MNSIDIRQAVPADAEALAALNAEFNGDGLTDAAHIRRSLEENRSEIVCITYADQQAAGFCCAQLTYSMCYWNPAAEITELYVKPDFRRKGVAQALLRLTEEICTRCGAKEFKLLTGGGNLAAQALYESLGYTPPGKSITSRRVPRVAQHRALQNHNRHE